jgi:hypothetical protein
MEGDDAAVYESSPRLGAAAHHFELVGGEGYDVELTKVARDSLALAVDGERLGVALNGDLKVPVDFRAARDAAAYDREALAEAYGLLRALRAEGFGCREEVDGFEPVGLTLSVLAVDDVEARPPSRLAAQIPELMHLKRFEQHTRILTHAARRPEPHADPLARTGTYPKRTSAAHLE